MLKFFNPHTLTAVLAFLFLGETVIAQARLENGTVFLKNGDSLQVSIDIIKTENNFQDCYFRPEGAKEEQAIGAEEINGFTLDIGRKFISKTIEVEGEIITVIAEYLVEGVNSLFVYRINTEEYYILTAPGKPDMVIKHELQNAQLETGEDVKIRSNRYKGLLKYLMEDAPSLHSTINSMTLSQKSLVDISSEYHDLVCTTGEKCIVYKKTGIYAHSMFAPYLAMDFTSIKLSPERDLDTITFPFSPGYSAGGLLNIPVFRGSSFIDLQINMFYSNRHLTRKHFTMLRGSEVVNDLEYNYSSVGVALDTRFLVKPKELSYVFSVGPSVRLAIKQEMNNSAKYVTDFDGAKIRDYHYVIERKSAVGGVKTAAGILIPVTQDSMLQLSLDYYLQFGRVYLPRISTIFYGDYTVTEQVLAIKTALFF
jgi:hypothetical protein